MQNKYNLGLVSVSFRGYSPEEIVKAMLAAGLNFIEWGSDIHAPYKDIEKLRYLADLQKAHGITCCSYGTYFKFGDTPISELPDYINAAKILGTDVLRLWCGKKSGADMTAEEREEMLTLCRKAAKIAEEQGVTLCMECHKATFTERTEDALLLMREVNSPNFKMYWQPFQWLEAEQNIEIAKAISPYAVHLHVFNWKGKLRFPLADAISEWQNYLSAFSGERTLLLEFMPDDKIGSLSAEADALRKIAGGI